MKKAFATFRVEECICAVDILLIKEIQRNIEVTPVSPAPSQVAGIINLRGDIVTVFNLAHSLRIDRDMKDSKHAIILKNNADLNNLSGRSDETISKDRAALLVDEILDIISIRADQITHPPIHLKEETSSLLKGVAMLDDLFLLIPDIGKILSV